VREILEKDPKERVEDDIDILVEFMQNLQVIYPVYFIRYFMGFTDFRFQNSYAVFHIYSLFYNTH
jgi:hypothetical protein